MDNDITAEHIAKHYSAMGDSVDLINGIIDGSKMEDESQEDKNDCVDRNIQHLEVMMAKDFWTNEDMTAFNQAISDGKSYIG